MFYTRPFFISHFLYFSLSFLWAISYLPEDVNTARPKGVHLRRNNQKLVVKDGSAIKQMSSRSIGTQFESFSNRRWVLAI